MVRNPMNPNMVSKIDLNPDLIDCIVFWTKNPRNMMDKLEQLKNYHFYFLFTVTSYGPDLEQCLPEKDEIINTFIELSEKTGREKVIWRYDPILLTDTIGEDYHQRQFEYIARRLHSYTETCIFSFLDMYKKCERNLKGTQIRELSPDEMVRLAEKLNLIAGSYGIEMVTCAEEIDLSPIGIHHGKCIDDRLVSRICGYPVDVNKDSRQRKTCGCVESIDIGAYNTCNHICLYCYANTDADTVRRNMALHNHDSPLMLGELTGHEKIIARTVESFRKRQGVLF